MEYDTETGFYYVSSRYYDPEIGRFINADGYVSTGQDITGFNMFSYCGNNPINRLDPTGQFWSSIVSFVKTAISAIGNAIAGKAPVYAGLGTAALADGPAPIVDAIAAIGALAITADAIGQGINQAITSRTKAKEKEQTKSIAIPKQNSNGGTTYYHVTTPINAAAIMASGVMIGSPWEGGHVYAWKTMPSKYAIKNSGAKFGVMISFKTNATFSNDTGITDPRVSICGPVVSNLPGPIVVWDVKIMGVMK